MPNVASILKAEITRLARKEVRHVTESLRRAVVSYRSEIAVLKRRVNDLELQLKRSRREQEAAAPEVGAVERQFRFRPKGLAAQRRRLGLSAADCGLLLNTTGQSIYNWESGAARPRAAHMPVIAAMRKLGKRQAAEILSTLR